MSTNTQSMTKFFFRFRAPPRISFGGWKAQQQEKPNGISFEYQADKADVVVFDETLPTEPRMHYGIGFDVEVVDTDQIQAQIRARAIILDLIALISFCEACFVGIPELVTRYMIPESGILLEHATLTVLDKNYRPVETTLRPINFDRLKEVFDKVKSLNEGPQSQAINTSLHWFWKSLDHADIRDRFLQLWIAVERLEGALKSKYSIAASKTSYPKCSHCQCQFDLCPVCGQDFAYHPSSGYAGLKRLAVDCGLKGKLFDELHSIRSKLVHAGIAEEEQIRQALDDTRNLLAKAIFVLVDIEPSRTHGLPQMMRLQSRPMYMYFEGELKVGKPMILDDVHRQPVVYGQYQYDFEIDEESDELITLGEVSHEFRGDVVEATMEKKINVDSSHNVLDVWERED